jgi:hypothetical protein
MLVLDRNRHAIIETELSRFLQREFPRADLFMYRHTLYNTFVVAQWLNKDRGECSEIVSWSGDMEPKAIVETIRQAVLTPAQVQAARVRDAVTSREREIDEQAEREIIETAEYARHALRRRPHQATPLITAVAGGLRL